MYAYIDVGYSSWCTRYMIYILRSSEKSQCRTYTSEKSSRAAVSARGRSPAWGSRNPWLLQTPWLC